MEPVFYSGVLGDLPYDLGLNLSLLCLNLRDLGQVLVTVCGLKWLNTEKEVLRTPAIQRV